MPREGIFVKVLQSGKVKTGDEISVCEDKIRKTKVKAGVMLRMVGNAGFSLFIEKRVQIEIFKTKSEKF